MARARRSRHAHATPEPLGPDAPEAAAPAAQAGEPVCGLCLRPIPPGSPQSLHHLVPKLKGGTRGPTALLHHICHKEIHAALREAELARAYASLEALRAHPRLARFVEWVRKRPPGFISRVPRRRTRG